MKKEDTKVIEILLLSFKRINRKVEIEEVKFEFLGDFYSHDDEWSLSTSEIREDCEYSTKDMKQINIATSDLFGFEDDYP